MLHTAWRLHVLALVLLAPAFANPAPAHSAPANPRLPTLFLVGDLPAESVTPLFDATHLNVAVSPALGRTTRAYINSGDWDKLLSQVKPGDFILLDFVPTTLSAADKASATRTLQGIGDGTFEYLDPGTQKLELVHSYGWYLRRMVVDTINHGASPILCSPPASASNPASERTLISPNSAEPADSQPTPAAWSKAIATEQHVPFLDLTTSQASITPDTLKSALTTLQPDPLAPYLKR